MTSISLCVIFKTRYPGALSTAKQNAERTDFVRITCMGDGIARVKKGVVILIIVGALCYFGVRWFFSKCPMGARICAPATTGQTVSSRDHSNSDVIYVSDIISDTSSVEKEAEVAPTAPAPRIAKQEAKSAVKTTGPYTTELADSYTREGKKYEARNSLSDAYFSEKSAGKRKRIKEKLDKLNEELIFSPRASRDAVVYVVKPGDSLGKIAKQYKTSYELIMRLNKKQNTRIRINEKLKVLKGTVSLLVDKNDFTLTILLDGHYVKQYPVGTGIEGKTPVGKFKIKDKLKNPVWYAPDGVYKFGHPKNILGTRWLGFVNTPELQGFGIHGTALPETIGEESSMGCVRMYNKDVEELSDFVVPGTEVIIQE